MLSFSVKFQVPLFAAIVHNFKDGSCLPQRIYIALLFVFVKTAFHLTHLIFIAVAIVSNSRLSNKVAKLIVQLYRASAEEPVAETILPLSPIMQAELSLRKSKPICESANFPFSYLNSREAS